MFELMINVPVNNLVMSGRRIDFMGLYPKLGRHDTQKVLRITTTQLSQYGLYVSIVRLEPFFLRPERLTSNHMISQ